MTHQLGSYEQRTPASVLRTWEDFQRAGFRTAVIYSPWAPAYLRHCVTIGHPQNGNVEHAGETQDSAITHAVKRANEVWPVKE